TALYGAALAGIPSPLPELPLQYADFAVWQRAWLREGEMERQLSYWRRQLAGIPPSLDLPLDRPRPPVPSSKGGRLPVVLGPDLARGLARLARGHGATLFMVFLAGFQALLRRVTGQEDIPVGAPIANRNRAEIEPLIGFFVNTLVMRGDLGGDPTFRELLARTKRTTLEAYAHQDLPFERLVLELNPERNLSLTPLFQVLFVMQNVPEESADLPGLGLEPLPMNAPRAQFDLTLSLDEPREGPEGFGEAAGEINFNADLFHATTMTRLVGYLRALLASVVADPELRLSEIPLLSEAERAQVLWEWSGTPWEGGGELLLHRLVQARAAADPDALAVLSAAGEGLTYGELDARAGRLARRLRDLGAGPESRVVIAANRSPGLIVGMLAVLKAGGAYVPVDPGYPAERVSVILEDSGAVALLGDGDLGDRPGPSLADPEEIEAVDPANAAYVIYTSGSTGRPKGVVVSHRSAAIYVRDMAALQGLGPGDRVLQFGALGFDVTVQEIWCPLVSGATLVLRSEEMAGSVQSFLGELARLGVTTLPLPTAYWHELAADLERTGEKLPASVCRLTIGGEAVQPARLAAWLREENVPVLHCYGPTETTVAATTALLSGWQEGEAIPIGRPSHGARVYVVDPAFQLVPPGVWGELWIGGTGVARGYLERPDLTAAAFVPNPWSGGPGERAYRSGDRVRFLPWGDLEFGGRIDQQIKVRGFRVEPGEIEAVLAAHPGLVDVAVVARPGPGGVTSLLACVVAADAGGGPAPAELRSFLADRLPAHMIPAAFVVLPALPMTPNGKVDRQALARLTPDRENGAGTPPGTAAERAMAGLWKEVLAAGEVFLEDNFFDLGGHSLLATQLISRIRSTFGVDLPLRRLFEAPTLGELTAALAGREPAAPALEAVPRRPPGADPVPASFAQERLWFLDRLRPGDPAYNIPDALRVRGVLSRALLEAVLGEVVRRHEALRTTFEEREGQPVQVVAPPRPWRLPLADLSALPEEARRAEAVRVAGEEAARPFDLGRGPLLRTMLLRLDEAEHALLLTMHHIVSDGWSMGVLVREVGALYAAAAAGTPSPLPELPVQYPDFALWQRRWLEGGELERQLGYWRGRLDGVPVSLDLPADRPRPAVPSHRGAVARFLSGPALSGELERFARGQGATLFMAVLAGFQALLARVSGQEDFAVGSPIANRTRAEVEPLIGFFVNTL
ncbi:MAG TPA: amino acid adenylation domain-containing protein, partial [Thermoanaerobaculia bacterium]|nr:amino acid adenylation domain-containing protein [Thermoanaerobaculia bacterium]